MKRRRFLATAGAGISAALLPRRIEAAPGWASPAEAMKAAREKFLFVSCTYANTGVKAADYLAVVDADLDSATYSQVVHRLPLPNVGDELHHYGWNICSACHGRPGDRRYLIVPGLKSSRIHIIDALEPTKLKLEKVIEPDEIARKVNLSAPHTVHCLPDELVMISMLGDASGNGPGGFLLLDPSFKIVGRWEKATGQMKFNYDFWYQPRAGVMVSTEWAAPKTFSGGFQPDDIGRGKYGRRLNVWDWKSHQLAQSIDLGDEGLIPLEIRFAHDPEKTFGFVGAALSSTIWTISRNNDPKSDVPWKAEPTISVKPVVMEGKPVPGLISDLVVSMDDRFLYFANWLQGDVRQYDISDPFKPKLTGQIYIGGLLGKAGALHNRKLAGGPQMLQLSLDGRRLFITNSLYSTWDNQFYPAIAKQGSWLVQINCDTSRGGLAIDKRMFLDFGREPNGPARAHEIRYPGGDCTSDIFS
ncbi:MAG TPA: selenium-binding protein SBP56-related protein [Pirellulales bacterium]|nr:selenium-binding protein SBP56-related protein [Pirellulales bacterium]